MAGLLLAEIDRSFVAGLDHPDAGGGRGDTALVAGACGQAQGFLWSKPLLTDGLDLWLEARAPSERLRAGPSMAQPAVPTTRS